MARQAIVLLSAILISVSSRGMRIRLIAHALCLCLLMGCMGELSHENLSQIGLDFQHLFEIGYKLADPEDVDTNIEGLKELYRWATATKNSLAAAYVIEHDIMTRDLDVQAIISQYHRDMFLLGLR